MTQDELKAALLLIGFIHRGAHVYSLSDKSLWVEFNTNTIAIQKHGLFPEYRWTTFRATPQAAFDFIKEKLA